MIEFYKKVEIFFSRQFFGFLIKFMFLKKKRFISKSKHIRKVRLLVLEVSHPRLQKKKKN